MEVKIKFESPRKLLKRTAGKLVRMANQSTLWTAKKNLQEDLAKVRSGCATFHSAVSDICIFIIKIQHHKYVMENL